MRWAAPHARLGDPRHAAGQDRRGERHAILAGGAATCQGAGIPVAGGHSIDTAEPIYGLAVIGTCRPEQLRRNADARVGDALILTKGIGVGIYANALRKGVLDDAGYAEMLASTTQLNSVGAWLGQQSAVHAVTDVTGFGVIGHGAEMARGSKVSLRIKASSVPLLTQAQSLVEQGFVTGASHRNWESCAGSVSAQDDLPLWMRHLLTDAQTSGGLLVSCERSASADLLSNIRERGYHRASLIGVVETGDGRVIIDMA